MMITNGKLTASDGLLEIVGEYWTSEAVADHNTVCINYCNELLSMDKAVFPDWLQEHNLLMDDDIPTIPDSPAFNLYDISMDIE